MSTASYRVDLDVFSGPLDLLLYLVKREEVEITQIPLARLVGGYLQHLEVLQQIDMEVAGDFLVLASTLMEIKSRALLPVEERPDTADAPDPLQQELVAQLLAYKRYKEAALELRALAAERGRRYARQADDRPQYQHDAGSDTIREVELWDLVSAFGRILRETMALAPRPIVVDETPIEHYMGHIEERLKAGEPVEFRQLFLARWSGVHGRSHLIGLFLALLELVKLGRIVAVQEGPRGAILLQRPQP